MMPSAPTMKPEPWPRTGTSRGRMPRWNWRKNSIGSLMSGVACARPVTLMLTTAGP
jgi:hypothetical protein